MPSAKEDVEAGPVPKDVSAQAWHFFESGERRGPVTTEDLGTMIRDGTLSCETHVWSPGLADWMRIREVDGLSGLTAEAADKASAVGEGASEKSPEDRPKTCPYCAESVRPEALICRHCGRQMSGNWFARGPEFFGNVNAG